MKKRTFKIILIVMFIAFVLSSQVLAVSDIFSQADGWISTGKNHTNTTMDTTKLKTTSDTIYNVFLGVGTAVAVIVGAILGIQFMTAGIDKKVEVKQALIPYIISCIVIFGSFGIWKLVITILGGLNL